MTRSEITTQWIHTIGGYDEYRKLYRLTALVRQFDLERAFDDVTECYLFPYLGEVPEIAEESDQWELITSAACRLAFAVLLKRRAVVTALTVSEPTKENANALASRTTAEVRLYRSAGVAMLRDALLSIGVSIKPYRFAPILDDEI